MRVQARADLRLHCLFLYCSIAQVPGHARPQVAITFRENGGKWANLIHRLFPDVEWRRRDGACTGWKILVWGLAADRADQVSLGLGFVFQNGLRTGMIS